MIESLICQKKSFNFFNVKGFVLINANYFHFIGSVSKRKTDDCMRKNGKIEPTDCCSETAHEWKTSYTNKKHCTDLPTYQPCSPPTPPPSCEYETPMCNAIFGKYVIFYVIP